MLFLQVVRNNINVWPRKLLPLVSVFHFLSFPRAIPQMRSLSWYTELNAKLQHKCFEYYRFFTSLFCHTIYCFYPWPLLSCSCHQVLFVFILYFTKTPFYIPTSIMSTNLDLQIPKWTLCFPASIFSHSKFHCLLVYVCSFVCLQVFCNICWCVTMSWAYTVYVWARRCVLSV